MAARERKLKAFLVLMLAGLAMAVPMLDVPARIARLYERLWPDDIPAAPQLPEAIASKAGSACDTAMPPHGMQYRFDDVDTTYWNAMPARMFVSNEHAYPAMLILTDLTGNIWYQAVSLHPGLGAQVRVPVGHYGMRVMTGHAWCNMNSGFVNGAAVVSPQQMELRADQVMNLRLMPFGGGPGDVMFSIRSSLGMTQASAGPGIEGYGALAMPRYRGHYVVNGSINGNPLTFMVDTGAYTTTVSREFAAQAGLKDCRPHQVSTANGTATACMAVARELTLGQFRLQNVEVDIMDRLGGVHLLGMNVIGQFRMEQQGDIMRLSAK